LFIFWGFFSVLRLFCFLRFTTPQEVSELIASFNSSKASGPSGIPLASLKLCNTYTCVPLSSRFNQSFSFFPNKLKLSKIIPLHKDDSTYELSNYRPISLLSPISKLLEKLMHTRLFSFLNKNKLINLALENKTNTTAAV